MHFTYRYQPKMVKYMGYEPVCRQGSVTVTHATNAVITGNGTDFQSDMIGSIIRLGTTTAEAEPVGALRSYSAQAEITGYSSATIMAALPTVLPTASAGTKYAISDPIDASPQMYTAILSACEMWYARIAGKPADASMQLYGRDLRIAMENDEVSPLSGRPLTARRPTPLTMGWHSTLRGDVE
jgi:hypothetical protein